MSRMSHMVPRLHFIVWIASSDVGFVCYTRPHSVFVPNLYFCAHVWHQSRSQASISTWMKVSVSTPSKHDSYLETIMGDWNEMERVLETRHPEMNMARVANAVAVLSDWAGRTKLRRKKSETPSLRGYFQDNTGRRKTWSTVAGVQADESVSLLDEERPQSQPVRMESFNTAWNRRNESQEKGSYRRLR
ncbi:hypothetical protein CERZMDRAFT_93882 [Cercospora zeae-maydis SCOH1-5]|uniref:Uncharacterized protein n=1 Tax=Cercospora zeae-maydis SCOH1-5 TaxID=717836 RepID=A0A6A6FTI4_9PEZI|nr:hypothetical protein CERZMDRAFT_93882 [Cercospora zeae-maydis SCOH1-5]